jgi:hypothetical protein
MTLQALLVAIVVLGALIALRETLHLIRRNRRGRP